MLLGEQSGTQIASISTGVIQVHAALAVAFDEAYWP
jgi:hypothetical protein